MQQSSIEGDRPGRQLENIAIMQKLAQLQSSIQPIAKTVILCDVYKKKEEPLLGNLHTFAQKLLDQSLDLRVQTIGKGKKTKQLYSIDPSALSSIKRKCVSSDGSFPANESFQDYIGIYEKGDVRVVGLPLPKDLIDHSKGEKFQAQLKQRQKKKMQEAKQQGRSNQASRQWQYTQQKQLINRAKDEYPKFLNIVQIQTILSILISKSQSITVAGLIDDSQKRHKHVRQYLQEFKGVFKFTQQPQFILHSVTEDSEQEEYKQLIQSDLITTIYTIDQQEKVVVKTHGVWNEKYFVVKPKKEDKEQGQKEEKEPIQTSIFQCGKDKDITLSKNAYNFLEDWRQLAKTSVGFIVDIINQIKNSVQASTNKHEISLQFKFLERCKDQVSDKYSSGLKHELLGKYFSTEKCKARNLDQKISIPQEIKCLVLANECEQIIHPFLRQYNSIEQKYKLDQTAILPKWKQLFKQLHQLILAGTEKQTHKKQIQRNFDILCFLIEVNKVLKKSIGVEVSLSSTFKVTLEKNSTKNGQVLRHIIADKNPIPKNMSLNYYSLYLGLIVSNQKEDIKKETKYRECQIRELRAFEIACNYIYDEAKIVEAIKDYAIILIEASSFSKQMKSLVSIQDIQKKLAKLLIIIGMQDKAAEVYLNNRNVGLAYKVLSFLKLKHQGGARAQLLIDWGKKFQKELEYELALNCYRQAFDCAKGLQLAKQSVQCKVDCRKKIRNGDPEDVAREFSKFLSPETNNLNEFTSLKSLLSLFQQIKTDLQWDEEAGMAVLKKEQKISEGAIQTQSSIQSQQKGVKQLGVSFQSRSYQSFR